MITNANFYDIHGNNIQDGVISLASVNHSVSSNLNFEPNTGDAGSSQSREHLNFTAIYWPSAEAKNAGLPHLDFKDHTQSHLIQINVDALEPIGDTPIIDYVESYIADVLLPSMSSMLNLNSEA